MNSDVNKERDLVAGLLSGNMRIFHYNHQAKQRKLVIHSLLEMVFVRLLPHDLHSWTKILLRMNDMNEI